MNLFRSFLLLLLSSLTLHCAHLAPRENLPEGVDLLFAGKSDEAHKIFASECQQGSQLDCALEGSHWSSPKELPFLQGFSNTEWVQIHSFPNQNSKVHYFYRPSGPFALKPLKAERVQVQKDSRLQVDQLKISVRPGVTYELLALSERGELLDRRRFSGLSLTVKGQKFALLSCLDDSFAAEQKIMWNRVREEKPDVIFMIGDNTYATRIQGQHVPQVSPQELWSRYEDVLTRLDLYRWEKLVPVWAIWDDHDYGMRDGDRTYRYRREAQDMFAKIFPQKAGMAGFEKGPGISFRVRMEDLDLYFLDNRSFRSPEASADYGHWGREQTDWLLDSAEKGLRASWWIQGDQFFGGYHSFDSFEGSHPQAFEQFLGSLKEKVRGPLLFLSGDRHHFELMRVPAPRLGYETFEITSSALHAKTYPDSFIRSPNPNLVAGLAGKLNFAILEDIKAQGSSLSLQVSAYSEEDKPLVQRRLKVESQ